MRWKKSTWEEVLTIKNGKNQKAVADPNGPFPIYGSGGIMGYANDYLCEAGTTIIGRKGSINNPIYVKTKFWNVDTAFGLCAKTNLDSKYLYYFCLTYNFLKHNKATTLPSLTKADLLKIEIPLPPLEEQKKIAAILDAADALRQKDKALITKYEELIQSLFLNMFGDPVTNPKGWERKELSRILSFLTSGSRGWSKYYSDNGDIFLRIQNVGYNQLRLDDLTFVEAPESAESKRTKVEAGDVVLSITADLGRTAVIPPTFPKAHINQHLAILRLNDEVNPYYVSAYIATSGGQTLFQILNKGGVKAGLNFDDIRSYEIMLPPFELQNLYYRRLNIIEEQKKQAEESLQKSEELFNSLLQRAFKGELTQTLEPA
ncbi:restriction endonuclease subunit S [Nafulsella turpanensis]|uniref:restriction endonuclease subunit S n=1 Tax=Nafulsella turpanensis TaxID=1265690 RepID=UPI000378A6F1|nr:restriction endonuclease subunit S [Nafulsella turpanensis]